MKENVGNLKFLCIFLSINNKFTSKNIKNILIKLINQHIVNKIYSYYVINKLTNPFYK